MNLEIFYGFIIMISKVVSTLAIKRSKFAKFLNDQGMIVIIITISMFDEIYTFNRQNFKNYFEVYIKCDIQELIKRDQKSLY